MALKITKVKLPPSKYDIKCPYHMTAQEICIHNTDNDASAMNEVVYMQRNNNQVSYHYAVDDTRAVQALPLNRNAWHAGDGNGRGNRKAIGIEICYSKSGGQRFKKAEQNAAKLTAILLYERGWGISKVKRHKDYSGKNCPSRTMKLGWNRFKKMVNAELKALKKNGKPASKPATSKPSSSKSKLTIDGYFGEATIKATQRKFKIEENGRIYRQPLANEKYIVRATRDWKFTKNIGEGSLVVKKMQKLFGVQVDGYFGQNSVKGMQRFLNKQGFNLKVDGYMGDATVRAWQKYLNK